MPAGGAFGGAARVSFRDPLRTSCAAARVAPVLPAPLIENLPP
jgi:hypothetical protein